MNTAYYMYKDTSGFWRWRFMTTTNNRIIAVSSESYHNASDCEWSINLVKGSSNAAVYKV